MELLGVTFIWLATTISLLIFGNTVTLLLFAVALVGLLVWTHFDQTKSLMTAAAHVPIISQIGGSTEQYPLFLLRVTVPLYLISWLTSLLVKVIYPLVHKVVSWVLTGITSLISTTTSVAFDILYNIIVFIGSAAVIGLVGVGAYFHLSKSSEDAPKSQKSEPSPQEVVSPALTASATVNQNQTVTPIVKVVQEGKISGKESLDSNKTSREEEIMKIEDKIKLHTKALSMKMNYSIQEAEKRLRMCFETLDKIALERSESFSSRKLGGNTWALQATLIPTTPNELISEIVAFSVSNDKMTFPMDDLKESTKSKSDLDIFMDKEIKYDAKTLLETHYAVIETSKLLSKESKRILFVYLAENLCSGGSHGILKVLKEKSRLTDGSIYKNILSVISGDKTDLAPTKSSPDDDSDDGSSDCSPQITPNTSPMKNGNSSPLKKDGTPDMRFKENRGSSPLKKDGTPDMRFKVNKGSSPLEVKTPTGSPVKTTPAVSPSTPLKKDGTPDMRFSVNKQNK